MAGPGHGAPAVYANIYLEGTYTQYYPEFTQDEKGIELLCRKFSSPGGIPSHVSAGTPGSIHEGGELGYCIMHATGAVFDNPDLIVTCIVGDGEAETGPLEGSWKSIRYLNPVRDGAVLPVLHLNGYKISSATALARMDDEDLESFFTAHGYDVLFVEGDDPNLVHPAFAEALDTAYQQIRDIQQNARNGKEYQHIHWPLIVLRTPKGWTCPKELDGATLEGSFHAHQVPIPDAKKDKEQLKLLEEWMRSYEPEKLFDKNGRLSHDLKGLIPQGDQRMGVNPHANGGGLLKEIILPFTKDYEVEVKAPGTVTAESTKQLGQYIRDVFRLNEHHKHFRFFCPDETESNRLTAIFEATGRFWSGKIHEDDEHLSPDGRVMEVLSEHLCQGWMEGYLLSGRHGVFSCYEAFITIIDSMFSQYAKWLKMARELKWRHSISSFTYLLTSHTWRQDHNGYSHQGPGFIDTVVNKKSHIIRIYLPPDANCLLEVTNHCLSTKDEVNVIVAGKQPALQWLSLEEAHKHLEAGASTWQWASNDNGQKPDIVIACAGDIPTMEAVAAAWLLRKHLPDMKVRLVNVISLMSLAPPKQHPHGMEDHEYNELFTDDVHVIFAFHGYVRIIHDLVHGRSEPERFHVRGFMEEGTTTTPFDMVVLNNISRYQLAIEAIKRSTYKNGEDSIRCFEKKLKEHYQYIREHLDDMPEIKDWKWTKTGTP
jgi:xylulose-5-phosphate/fructose-6-phosphate phosphoketolase